MLRILIIMSVLLTWATTCPREITFDDLYGLPKCEGVRISPDGRQVVFVLKTTDAQKDSSESHLWIMDVSGDGMRQLTYGSGADWSPRWASDGKAIYFLSNRTDTAQVWRLPIDGGEARRVTAMSTSVSDFDLFPTGDKVLCVSRVFPDCHSDSCNRARLEGDKTDPTAAKVYDRLLYRHYNRWDDGRVNRLFSVDVADAAVVEIYQGGFDAPTALLGSGQDFAVSPDGREVCFVMSVDSMPAVRVNNDIYIAAPGDKPVRLTDSPALDISPKYSPDGEFISYLGMARAGYESDQQDLKLYDRKSGKHINLTADFDRSIDEYAWAPDGRVVYFTAVEHGFSKVWRLEVASGKIELLLGDAVYGDLQVSPDNRMLIISRSLSDEPRELYRYDLSNKRLTRLTHVTEKILADLTLTRAEEFWYIGALGDSVHGFLTRPPGCDSSKKYPLALLIHGGPQSCWLGDFNYYGWNTQLVAAQGYVVAQFDIHGSAGYGVRFQDYISVNWGKGDFEDIMKGVDYLLAAYPFIDSTRMAALGRSYGGFMVNWICGHTDRFRCLISIDGTYNHLSMYGTTEELWFPEWEFRGTPYDNWDEYVRSSPVTYAANFRTPTMVIHGGKDYRVDLSEGLQMFTALQRLGVPSQLVYFPDEGHSVSKLGNLRFVYEKQFEWLARWLK